MNTFDRLLCKALGVHKQSPPRQGLVRRKVQVRRGGKTFEREQWVRPQKPPLSQQVNAPVDLRGKLSVLHANLKRAAQNFAATRPYSAEKEKARDEWNRIRSEATSLVGPRPPAPVGLEWGVGEPVEAVYFKVDDDTPVELWGKVIPRRDFKKYHIVYSPTGGGVFIEREGKRTGWLSSSKLVRT